MGAKFCLGRAIMSSRVERYTCMRLGSGGVPANSPCKEREMAQLSAAERDRDFEYLGMSTTQINHHRNAGGGRDGEGGRKR